MHYEKIVYMYVHLSLFFSVHFKFGSGDFSSKIPSKFAYTIFEFTSFFLFLFSILNLTKIFLNSTSATISQIELRISALVTRTKMKDKISVLIFNIHLFSIISSYFL